jgi:hypothetical protein
LGDVLAPLKGKLQNNVLGGNSIAISHNNILYGSDLNHRRKQSSK